MCDNFKKTEGISEQSEDANARERIPRGPKNHRWTKNFQSWSTPESKRWLWQRTKMFWQPPELSERFDNFLITIRGIISIWAEAYGREQEWKTCRWISREGRSLPFLVALYKSNGSMPLDLQRGSKLAVLMRDCVQVKRKHAAGSPERVKVYRSQSHKASIQAKHGKHAAGSPERVEVSRACEGYRLQRCYYPEG